MAEPAAVTIRLTSLLINVLAPLALVLVGLLVLRKRRRRGWMLIAAGGALQFLAAVGVPVGNYTINITATRMGTEALVHRAADAALVGMAGSIGSALGIALVIVGIIRLSRDSAKGQG